MSNYLVFSKIQICRHHTIQLLSRSSSYSAALEQIVISSFFFFKQYPLHNFHLSNYPAAQPIIARARRVIKPDSKIVAPGPSPEATIIIHYNSPLPIPLLIPADVIAAAPTLPRRKSCVHISCPPVDTV